LFLHQGLILKNLKLKNMIDREQLLPNEKAEEILNELKGVMSKNKDLASYIAFERAYQTCEFYEKEYYYWKEVKEILWDRLD
jgi:hypothetical protein